jgi:hypothetical protein
VQRRVIRGDDVVIVGDWAQLEVGDGAVAIAFPSEPPARDLARLMHFLAASGWRVETLPAEAFRAP